MHRFRNVLFAAIQCSWGILQTLVGLAVFFNSFGRPHRFINGVIYTPWPDGGVSLGLFVFSREMTDTDAEARLSRFKDYRTAEMLFRHEYGHSIQSLILGPLYLPVIGIPSFIWSRKKSLARMRGERGISYYSFFSEKWADMLGGVKRPHEKAD